MSFYSQMATTANKLLTKFGAIGTLTRVTVGEYDPDTGSAATTETAYSIRAAVFPVEQKDVDGELIKATDNYAIASVLGAALPVSGDKFTFDGDSYTVLRVKELAPSGFAVIYEMWVRK